MGKLRVELILKRKFLSKPAKDGKIKIITLNYWDTRKKFSQAWKYNIPIVEHNFLIEHKNLPQNYFVEEHIFLHKVSEIPSVYDLVNRLKQKYNVILHIFEMDLSGIDHYHKFNFVAKKSYEILGNRIFDFDYVFIIGQDNFLVNNLDENLFVRLIKLFNRKEDPLNEKIGHYRKESYNYISHTISENPQWKYFQHNAAVQKGFYKIDRYPYVLESVSHSGNLLTSESYLGKGLREKCLYLKPNEYFYYSEYILENLLKKTVLEILKRSAKET